MSEHHEDDTARRILQAARQLFMAQGYRRVSTRDVAAAIGLTQPALYHYFKNKEELYTAVMLDELQRIGGGLERICRRSGAVPDRLREAAAFMVGTSDFDFAMMQHDVSFELSPERRARLAEAFFARVVRPLAEVFTEAQTNGTMPTESQGGMAPVAASGFFLSTVAHFLSERRTTRPWGEELSTNQMAATITKLVLFGLSGSAVS